MSLTVQLVKPVAKASPLVPFGAAALIAVGIAWMATLQPAEAGIRLTPARLGAMALTMCAAFLFDDPAGRLTNPAPHPLRLRRLIRAVCGYLAVFIILALTLLITSQGMDLVWIISDDPVNSTAAEALVFSELSSFPAGRIVLETSTTVAFALAVAAVVSHRGQDQPGRLTSTIVLGAFVVSWMIPEAYRPWADPTDQRWTTSANWWWFALSVFLAIAVAYSWEARHRARGFRSGTHRPRGPIARGQETAAP